jgi:hypothetical protein
LGKRQRRKHGGNRVNQIEMGNIMAIKVREE